MQTPDSSSGGEEESILSEAEALPCMLVQPLTQLPTWYLLVPPWATPVGFCARTWEAVGEIQVGRPT